MCIVNWVLRIRKFIYTLLFQSLQIEERGLNGLGKVEAEEE